MPQMQDPQLTPIHHQHVSLRPPHSSAVTPTNSDIMRSTRRTSSSATDYDESFSDLDSILDVPSSPSQTHPESSPDKKGRTPRLRLSLKDLRTPMAGVYGPPESESSPDTQRPPRLSLEGPRLPYDRRVSLDLPPFEGRTSLDAIDPRRREQLASPPQLSASAPKTSTRFSFIHSPTPSTPTMARPTHHRSSTTPIHSPAPSSVSTSPRRMMASPSPQPVKETHTMMKDYDPTTGNKMINKYMVVRELGRGVHGKVKLCRDTETDELCAIKIVDKTTRRRLGRAQISNEQKIRREIAIMKKCIHPNVVRLIEVIDDPSARKIYLVLEFMEGGEVRWKDIDELPILPLDDARAIFRDIVLGLEYLHMQGIIHRDIKPANLLLAADGAVKISDFGVSHFSEKNGLEHDLENTPVVDKMAQIAHSSNPFENFFRHPVSHSPLFSGRNHMAFGNDQSHLQYQQPQFSTQQQQQQWGDDLELAKTAGSPAFFAPELCYACEFSPALSPAPSTASQTSFILTVPTPRTNPSTPTGTISGQGYAPRPPITKAIDIWALGVTLYCFVYGRCPFIAETEFELFNIISRKTPSYQDSVPGRDFVSDTLKDLLSRLLEKDVGKRITLKEVKEHPWVTEDLDDPEAWRNETDPCNYQRVHITEDDLKGAVTIMDRIKNRIRKLSVSLSNFGLNRRRSKSISSNAPDSPTGTRSPIPIIRSPVPTTSQSSAHATAQPHTYTSTVPLPERFQHFHSYSTNTNPLRSVRSDRPHSSCSNTSSIEEVDEDASGSSLTSALNGGRRQVLRSSGALEPRPTSTHSYSATAGTSWRNLSDDHLDQSHGQLSRRSLPGGALFNGTASARVVPMGHSNLSKSWVKDSSSETDQTGGVPVPSTSVKPTSTSAPSLIGSSGQQQQHQQQEQRSHCTSTLSPSSTLVADIAQEQSEQSIDLSKSQESLTKPSSTPTSVFSDQLADSHGL